MKRLYFTLFFSLLTLFSLGQTADTTQNISKHHLGFHIGSITGFGISYRYWHKRFGIQATGFPILSKDIGNYYSAGLSILYILKDNKKADLFGYVGNHILNINGTNKLQYNLGVGIGLKLDFLEVLDLSLQAGYGIYNLQSSPSSLLSGEIGLYYHL